MNIQRTRLRWPAGSVSQSVNSSRAAGLEASTSQRRPLTNVRKRVEALDQISDACDRSARGRRPGYCRTGRAVVPVGEDVQVMALGGRHPQRRCQGVQHLRRGPHRASLLEKGVVGDGQVRQLGDLLAAQPSRPPPASCRQTDIAGHEPLAPRPEQLPEGLRVSGSRHVVKPTPCQYQ